MAPSRNPIRAADTSEDQSVTTLELFFDLVFVFALTQITALMAHDLSWHGVLRGVLLIGLLWWSWIGFSWLCNLVKADEGSVRGVLLAGDGGDVRDRARHSGGVPRPARRSARPGGDRPVRTSPSGRCTWSCSG